MSTHSTHCRMFQAKSYCCSALDEIKIEGTEPEEKLVDCLTTQRFRFCSVTPERLPFPTPEESLDAGQSTLWSVLAGPSHRIVNKGGGERAVTKTQRKKGGTADSTLRGRRKRYLFVKNKHVWCLSGALQQKGKKEMSLFSIIIQTCSTKTTNHIHKPLIGTVYLSENIIEPRTKKAVFLKVSLDNKQVRHLKVSSVRLWQVHCCVFNFKMSPCLQTGLKGCFLSVIFISPHSWHYTRLGIRLLQ